MSVYENSICVQLVQSVCIYIYKSMNICKYIHVCVHTSIIHLLETNTPKYEHEYGHEYFGFPLYTLPYERTKEMVFRRSLDHWKE